METPQPLEKRIHSECEQFLREKKSFEVSTLRMLISAFQTKQIEKRGKGGAEKLTEDEVLEVITRETKKRREASKAFRDGGRNDLADKEDAERLLLEKYLPPQASEEEVNEVIVRVYEKIRPESEKDFGKMIGEAMKTLKGRADAGTISSKIKEYFLSKS